MNAQVLGVSVDHIPCLKAWAESLGGIHYPLLSDFWPHGAVSQLYGVLRPEGYSERAIFLIDREGIIRYIDIHNIDHQPDNETIKRELMRLEGSPVQDYHPAPPEALPKGGIVMYCTKWCPDCRKARDWLQARHLEFTEIDIDANPLAAEQVKKWTGGKRITPTFDIDGVIVIDFDQRRLEQVLQNHLR